MKKFNILTKNIIKSSTKLQNTLINALDDALYYYLCSLSKNKKSNTEIFDDVIERFSVSENEQDEAGVLEGENEEVKVTAKVMVYNEFDINNFKKMLSIYGVKKIDVLFLGFVNNEFSEERIKIIYESLSNLDLVKEIGVVDFSIDLLGKFQSLDLKINQIYYKSEYKGLLDYCKSHGIKLLTHGGNEIIEPKMFRALLRKHGLLNEPDSPVSINIDCCPSYVANENSPVPLKFSRNVKIEYVCMLSSVDVDRGVGINQSYFLKATDPDY